MTIYHNMSDTEKQLSKMRRAFEANRHRTRMSSGILCEENGPEVQSLAYNDPIYAGSGNNLPPGCPMNGLVMWCWSCW